MNWMKASLGRWSRSTFLLGAIAGIWGALLYHAALWVTADSGAGVWSAGLTGLGLGLGLCGLLAATEELINRFLQRALVAAAWGGGFGMVLGAGGFALIAATSTANHPAAGEAFPPGGWGAWLAVPLVMGMLGAAGGAGLGFAVSRRQRSLRRMMVGGASGTLAGIPFALLLAVMGENSWVMPILCAAWGAVVAWSIFWAEKRFARRWLRLLTGPGEDTFFPLTSQWITLGKQQSNDIPLVDHQEVFPFHCHLKWEQDHYQIVEKELGGIVLVNYRQIHEQTLKSGDLVKLGTALLQYGEAS